ncbi:hypothetical protein RRG48_05630 [Mycoplasmopsis canis]|uniref:Ig-specific serine endopeptidase MIP n=1 Tax=Mycoplasmopsis cynos TaxID=171284 RepID=UPI002AFF8E16|nr:hypothetical protein [Mycoplasmopsis cynos]WQQ12831.1 hypothetical protein RRG58_02530 [Mycoplasmopsis cynos]WQQ14040.1 hypothetical protein RRG52_00620 [Mycoplasmopsis cynos]
MKKTKPLLFISIGTVTSLLPLIIASCNNKTQDEKHKNDSSVSGSDFSNNEETEKYLENKTIQDIFTFKSTLNSDTPLKFSNYTANEFVEKLNLKEILLEPKNNKLKFFVTNVLKEPGDSVRIYINFSESIQKNYIITGFKKGNIIEDLNITKKLSDSEFTSYLNLDQESRYKKDFENYYPQLKSNEQLRSTPITEQQKQEFDKKAKELHLPTYDNANLLGFTIPKYDDKGNVIGLDLKEKETGKTSSLIDNFNKDQYKNIGLARTITNSKYANIAMQTYQFNITNWIVSYEESERKKAHELLKNDEDLSLLINEVKNQEKKTEFLDRFTKNKNNAPALKLLLDGVYEQLKEDYGSDIEASKVFTKYVKNQRAKIKKRIEDSDLKSETKKRIYPYINEAVDFYKLELLSDQKNSSDGTAWIFDYELPENGKYPTKFYFATNLHVLDQIDKDNNYFDSIGLSTLSSKSPALYNTLKINSQEERIKHFGINKEAVTRIFDGRDYLKKDPKDFIKDDKFDKKEFIDFAVFEVDFSKWNDLKDKNGSTLSEELKEEKIKEATNDYANLSDDKKVKFANFDYLTNYSKINAPLAFDRKLGKSYKEIFEQFDSLYILGFPKSKSKDFFDFYLYEGDGKYRNKTQIDAADSSFSLWTNASYKLYEKNTSNITEREKERNDFGSYLSYNLGYRTFTDKPGIIDQFISAPAIGKGFYRSKNDDKEYVSMNLGYIPKQYAPGGGASGSSVRNQDNKVVGIIHASNFRINASVAAALRSNGMNYNGLFGEYNLPQYDVIYGTGKDQQNSYRDEMKKKSKKKTWLFKNGFELENVPEEYKFKN